MAETVQAQPSGPLVAALIHGSEHSNRARMDAFRDGMRDLGYVEGRSYRLRVWWTDGQSERLPTLANELVLSKPDVAIAAPVISAQAIARFSTKIPIVMASGAGALQAGLIASLANPGGNVIGVTNQGEDITQKLFELLREIAPSVTRVMAVSSGRGMVETDVRAASRAATNRLGMTLIDARANLPEEISQLADRCENDRCEAMVILLDPILSQRRGELLSVAGKVKVPTIYSVLDFVRDGGLIAYGADQREDFRRTARFVDRILHGAKPADLPVEQPTKFELMINLRAAKTLGIAIPQSVLARADEVIE